jgi:hypothetical protein
VAVVDPNDDLICRYVVQSYACDPERHERRHQVVVAFDNEQELMALINARQEELERRRAAGEVLPPPEHYSGVVLEPGYRRRTALARLVWKAAGRRVSLSEVTLERVDWHPDVGFFWSAARQHRPGARQ